MTFMKKLYRILNNKTIIGNLILLGIALLYLFQTTKLPSVDQLDETFFSASTLPILLSLSAIFFVLLQLFLSFRKNEDLRLTGRELQWRPLFFLGLLMIGYAALFETLGFILASISFLFFAFRILGGKKLFLNFIIAGGLVFFMWLLLSRAFNLHLEAGDLYRWLSGG